MLQRVFVQGQSLILCLRCYPPPFFFPNMWASDPCKETQKNSKDRTDKVFSTFIDLFLYPFLGKVQKAQFILQDTLLGHSAGVMRAGKGLSAGKVSLGHWGPCSCRALTQLFEGQEVTSPRQGCTSATVRGSLGEGSLWPCNWEGERPQRGQLRAHPTAGLLASNTSRTSQQPWGTWASRLTYPGLHGPAVTVGYASYSPHQVCFSDGINISRTFRALPSTWGGLRTRYRTGSPRPCIGEGCPAQRD